MTNKQDRGQAGAKTVPSRGNKKDCLVILNAFSAPGLFLGVGVTVKNKHDEE